MLVTAAGIGLMLLPLAASATAGIQTRDAGLASGLFNTARQLGGAIGLAALVTVAATATRHSQLASPATATLHGYRVALLLCAAVSLASVLIAFLLPAPASCPERNIMSSALEALRRDFGGVIIEPGGAEYEPASRTLLATGHPACCPAARERRGRASRCQVRGQHRAGAVRAGRRPWLSWLRHQ